MLSLVGEETADTSDVVGCVVSRVSASPLEAEEVLPAASVAVAVSVLDPEVSVLAVMDQLPDPSAVVDPTTPSTLELRMTVLEASDVPVRVGVVSLVILSVLLLPLSDAADRSGADGALGTVVSITMARPLEAAEVLPTPSVDVAVSVWLVAVSVLAVIDQLPDPSEVTDPMAPSTLESSETVTLASAVPVIVGVVSFVMLSVLLEPVSEALSRSRFAGTLGASRSTVWVEPDVYAAT